jgi:hypothetical protein
MTWVMVAGFSAGKSCPALIGAGTIWLSTRRDAT